MSEVERDQSVEEDGGVAVAEAEGAGGGATAEDVQDVGLAPNAPQAAAESLLSDADRAYLARRPAVQRATVMFAAAKQELEQTKAALESARMLHKGAEAAFQAAALALYSAETEDESNPMPLFEGGTNGSTHESAENPEYATAKAAWDAKWEQHLEQPVTVLELPPSLMEKIQEHEIATLRDLTVTKAESEGMGYTVIEGVGKANADKIDDAYEKLVAEFLKANPQPAAPAPASTDTPAVDLNANLDYNFEDTFPNPVDPTPNENYTSDYHIGIRNDAIDLYAELRKQKDSLANNTTVAGRPLSDRGRKQLEASIGDSQLRFDEFIADYAKTFGAAAGEKLQKYVEAKAEKKATLKGGLE